MEKCGLFGISSSYNSYATIRQGLELLQHRGRDSAGIAYYNNQQIKIFKGMGLVSRVFQTKLKLKIGIGHVRYSTLKKTDEEDLYIQPILNISEKKGEFALAHNGNIPNFEHLKSQFNYSGTSDSHLLTEIIRILLDKYNSWKEALIDFINHIEGVYCLLIITQKGDIYAIRDAYGYRPLVLTKNKNGSYAVMSESCAAQDFDLVRDIFPGEILKITKTQDIKMIYQRKIESISFCSFEYIYFMRHNSVNEGKNVEHIRYQLGFELGLKEKELYPDVIAKNPCVVCMPRTAISGAKGFADALNLPYHDYIEKDPKSGRSFILPDDLTRSQEIKKKFIFHQNRLKNKILYIVDDSIVRGNTFKHVIQKLREMEVLEIHIRITSPPVISQCYFGIDIPTKEELIAHQKSTEDIRKELGIESLVYLEIEEMKKIFNEPVCTSCFDGNYNKTLLDW